MSFSAYMSVYHTHAVPVETSRDIRSSGTGVRLL